MWSTSCKICLPKQQLAKNILYNNLQKFCIRKQFAKFEMNDPQSQFPKSCLKWRFAKIEKRNNYPQSGFGQILPFFHIPVCAYISHRRDISSFLSNLIVYTMLTIYLWKHIILAYHFDRHDQIDPLDHLVQLDHHDYPNTLTEQRICQKNMNTELPLFQKHLAKTSLIFLKWQFLQVVMFITQDVTSGSA